MLVLTEKKEIKLKDFIIQRLADLYEYLVYEIQAIQYFSNSEQLYVWMEECEKAVNEDNFEIIADRIGGVRAKFAWYKVNFPDGQYSEGMQCTIDIDEALWDIGINVEDYRCYID